MRALECSGPCPSKPCGRSRTRPERREPLVLGRDDELVDDDLRGVQRSRRTAPPRSTSSSGRSRRVAVLEAEDARLAERASRRPRSAPARRRRGARAACSGSPVSVSKRTAWRWQNVPRRASCPLMRMPWPSRRSDANARCSPVPQSSGWPRRRALVPLLEDLERLRVRVEPVGHRRQLARARRAASRFGHAVDTSGTAASGPPT